MKCLGLHLKDTYQTKDPKSQVIREIFLGNQLATQKHADDTKPSIKGTECHSNISSHWSPPGRLSQEQETKVASTKSHPGSMSAVSRGAQDHPLEST